MYLNYLMNSILLQLMPEIMCFCRYTRLPKAYVSENIVLINKHFEPGGNNVKMSSITELVRNKKTIEGTGRHFKMCKYNYFIFIFRLIHTSRLFHKPLKKKKKTARCLE